MTFKDMISMSVGNLRRRKLRTFLTVLGVLIGTTSIVAMLSIALGMKQMIMDSYSSFGSATQINVSQGYGENTGTGIEYMLSDSTLENIQGIEHVKAVNPILSMSLELSQNRYGGWGMLYGVSQDTLQTLEVGEGELPKTTNGSNMEVLIGNTMPADMYEKKGDDYIYPYYETGEVPDVDFLSGGMKYKMYYTPPSSNTDGGSDSDIDTSTEGYVDGGDGTIDIQARATGIMAGGVSEYRNQYSYCMVTDIDSMKNYLTKHFKKGAIPNQPMDGNGRPYKEWIYDQFVVEVDDAENVDAVQQSIIDMGFNADSNKDLLESTQQTFKIIELVLGGIGMIAFLVAAIGIANTMMMSTYERTKEIGIMKVLGCDMRDIMGLFLAEAGFIGFMGGVVGTVLTALLSIVANKVLSPIMENSGMGSGNISVIPLWLVVIAIIFATMMGVVAGFFPARRAMKLSPLAAIRNE